MRGEASSKLKTWVVRITVLAAVVGAGAWWKLRPAKSEATVGPPLEQVSRRTIERLAEASGALEPIRMMEVKSLASGEVLEVLHETGERVDAGTLLARIDPRDVENAYLQAVADLDAAKVRATTTDAQKTRLEALRKSNVVTDQEYESAIDAAATARAGLVRAQTNLQLAQQRRRDATIRAPAAGTLIERQVEPGQIIASATSNVSGGTVLFKMADLSSMQVRAKIDETDIGAILPGQTVTVRVEAFPGRTFRGVVHKIEPQSVIEQNVTLFPVLIRLENGDGMLRPGMNAEVSILIDKREDVLSVPNGAIVSMRDARAAGTSLGVSDEVMSAVLRREGDSSGGAKRSGQSAAPSAAPGEEPLGANKSTGGRGAAKATEKEGTKFADALATQKEGTMVVDASARERAKVADASATLMEGTTIADAPGPRRLPDGARPGILFVKVGDTIEPRRVLLGLADWDFTQVLRGVEAADSVVMVSLAQLEQRRQQMNDVMRRRSGIPGANNRPRGQNRGG